MNACKIWEGHKDRDGYGQVKIKGKVYRANRVALEISLGRKLKKEEVAMHLCGNPSCIKSDHLVVGTTRENNEMKRTKEITLADRLLSGWDKFY
jgi:hypothetical protein